MEFVALVASKERERKDIGNGWLEYREVGKVCFPGSYRTASDGVREKDSSKIHTTFITEREPD